MCRNCCSKAKMVPELRKQFNANFTPGKYARFLRLLNEATGTTVPFRNAETPCFFPGPLMERMCLYGAELIHQLVDDPDYQMKAAAAIPAEFNVPGDTGRPLFVQADFGLVRAADGGMEPRLVEIQGFPSLYAYQPVLARAYREAYDLPANLDCLLSGLRAESYEALLRQAILGGRSPDNVILMEVDPPAQKTYADFVMTERICGIRTISISDIEKEGRRLYYRRDGRRQWIERIYNRAIVDELQRTGVRLKFDLRDDLDVEWAGHPNWYFRISKFSIPFLRHRCVPRAWFLDRLEQTPADLENFVLKPLYSFAGRGVAIGPTGEDLERIPERERGQYLLQERVAFEPVIETPHGLTQAEVRIMYIWLDELTPVAPLIRMGRGKMMGVDHNRELEWVGGSAGFTAPS